MPLSQIYAAKVNGTNYSTVPPNVKGSGAGGNGGAAAKVGTSSTKLDNVGVSRYNKEVFASTVLNDDVSDKAVSAGTFAYNNQSPVAKKVTISLAGVSNTVLRSAADQPGLIRSIHKREAYRVVKRATAFRKGYWDPFYGKFEVYGTYSRSSSTVTVTAPNHGLANDDYVYLNFTSGAATDGNFQVTVVDANSFTITHGTSGSTSGNVTVVGPATATENPGNDVAATPTRSAPGQLVFLSSGAHLERTRDYKSKTG
jgi:hypothetical protein